MVCRAKEPCTNKTFVENYQFNINSQPYKFTSYLCEDKDEDDDVFLTPGILEVHGKNFNKTYKNVIGLGGYRYSTFTQWNDKHIPIFYYTITSSEYDTEGYMPIIIKDNNLMVCLLYTSPSPRD